MDRIAFKPFDRHDWEAMAGATQFANGDEPLVAYNVKLDGHDAYAVIDRNGLYIEALDTDGMPLDSFHAEGMVVARWIVGQPFAELTAAELTAAGFTRER